MSGVGIICLVLLSASLDFSSPFGPVPRPLPVAISKSLPATATASVYHSVGRKPIAVMGAAGFSRFWAILPISKTATESAAALAANSLFPSLFAPMKRFRCRKIPVSADA